MCSLLIGMSSSGVLTHTSIAVLLQAHEFTVVQPHYARLSRCGTPVDPSSFRDTWLRWSSLLSFNRQQCLTKHVGSRGRQSQQVLVLFAAYLHSLLPPYFSAIHSSAHISNSTLKKPMHCISRTCSPTIPAAKPHLPLYPLSPRPVAETSDAFGPPSFTARVNERSPAHSPYSRLRSLSLTTLKSRTSSDLLPPQPVSYAFTFASFVRTIYALSMWLSRGKGTTLQHQKI